MPDQIAVLYAPNLPVSEAYPGYAAGPSLVVVADVH